MTDQTYQGSCLCGAVRFEITGAFDGFFLCHCSRCRKGTGSAHASNLFSTTAQLHWLSGEDKQKTYQVPGARHSKCFCTDCGGALPRVQPTVNRLIVPAGSLDSPVDIRPNAHIFCASRANWDDCLEDVPHWDELPT